MAADIKLSDCYIAPYSQPCWDCANACGGCSWSANGNPSPVGRRNRSSSETTWTVARKISPPNLTKSMPAPSSGQTQGGLMTRLVIDIHEDGDLLATKEAVAMLLEPLGRVRVVSVIIDGKEEKR